jgi:hypothetical protein
MYVHEFCFRTIIKGLQSLKAAEMGQEAEMREKILTEIRARIRQEDLLTLPP